MTTASRPEWSTVATWDQLDRLAIDYRRLKMRLRDRNANVVHIKCVERTALQLETARNQVSLGEIEHATAIAVLQAAEQMFPLMRDLMYARASA